MPDFTVAKRGTDSSGRGIYATAYMWRWWQAVCRELGFTPTITQGAFMTRAGGGASASAGYHDQGGTFDLRVWDLTDAQVADTIRVLRANGAAAWLRNKEHGGFTDPHIHFVLGTDQPLSSGASSQWRTYIVGGDGLASGGRDYHPRPKPLVVKPTRSFMEGPKPVRFVTANMLKDRAGDKAYTRHLLKLTGRGILLRQEVGHGLTSTRIRGVKMPVFRMPGWVLGKVGVHRGVARARVRVDGQWVTVMSVHGLHLKSAGKESQDLYYATLKRRVGNLNRKRRLWVIGGDFNRPVAEVARMLGGQAHGEGIDGFVVRGLHVADTGTDNTGINKRWTDHPARWIDVTTTKG